MAAESEEAGLWLAGEGQAWGQAWGQLVHTQAAAVQARQVDKLAAVDTSVHKDFAQVPVAWIEVQEFVLQHSHLEHCNLHEKELLPERRWGLGPTHHEMAVGLFAPSWVFLQCTCWPGTRPRMGQWESPCLGFLLVVVFRVQIWEGIALCYRKSQGVLKEMS